MRQILKIVIPPKNSIVYTTYENFRIVAFECKSYTHEKLKLNFVQPNSNNNAHEFNTKQIMNNINLSAVLNATLKYENANSK